MRRSTKQNGQKVTFAGFTGGVNIARAGEQIAENEMQSCINFLYLVNSAKLTGRGGISAPFFTFGADIKDVFYDVDTNTLAVFLTDKKAYSMVVSEAAATLMGVLTGSDNPTCVKFQDKLWIASGGLLQYYNFTGLNGLFTVTSSPVCNIVFERFARLAVAATGNDRVTFSSVGDGETWTITTSNQSMSQWIDVGYGDSGDIIAIVPLATDLIIFKNNGKIYQLSGIDDFNTWVVNNLATNADTVGIRCADNIGNSVIFISSRGLKSLNAVQDYGNIAPSDIGDKFNALLTASQYEPRMYHLKRNGMIMIRPTDDLTYFVCYNYFIGAATAIKFGIPITSIVETKDEVILASGNQLFKWTNEALTDNGIPISYSLKPKDTIGSDEMHVNAIDTKFGSDYAGTATIKTGNLQINVPTNRRYKKLCNHTTDSISIELSSNDRFEVDHIALDVSAL